MTKLYTKSVTSCRECGHCDVSDGWAKGWCHAFLAGDATWCSRVVAEHGERFKRMVGPRTIPDWCPLPDEQPDVEIRAGSLSADFTVDSEAKLHELHELLPFEPGSFTAPESAASKQIRGWSITGEDLIEQMQVQARCRECDVPLDGVTPHEEDCDYALRLAEAMRTLTPEEDAARYGDGLRNTVPDGSKKP